MCKVLRVKQHLLMLVRKFKIINDNLMVIMKIVLFFLCVFALFGMTESEEVCYKISAY